MTAFTIWDSTFRKQTRCTTESWSSKQSSLDIITVVPATAGPLGERPPALAGHVCDVPTTLPC